MQVNTVYLADCALNKDQSCSEFTLIHQIWKLWDATMWSHDRVTKYKCHQFMAHRHIYNVEQSTSRFPVGRISPALYNVDTRW